MRYKRKSGRSLASMGAVGTLIIALIIGGSYLVNRFVINNEPIPRGECEFHFIDVGQGDCTMIITENDTVIIDAGPNHRAEETLAYIKEHTDKVDYLILTHPHEDHIGGADEIMADLPVTNIIMSDAYSETQTFSVLLDAIESSEANLIEGKAGDSYTAGDLELLILAPLSTFTDMNDYSLVTKVSFGNTSAIVTGDVEKHSEGLMVEEYSKSTLKASILKMGHHGSNTSNSNAFIDKVDPEFAVFSLGEGNSYGHPHIEVIEKVEERNITYFRTDEDGSIAFVSDGETVSLLD